MCYECNKLGHLRAECPQPSKKHKRKKKALMATWSDSEESLSKDDEHECTNLCLMTHENEVHSDSHVDPSLDKPYDALNELMEEYKKLKRRNKDTKALNLQSAQYPRRQYCSGQ